MIPEAREVRLKPKETYRSRLHEWRRRHALPGMQQVKPSRIAARFPADRPGHCALVVLACLEEITELIECLLSQGVSHKRLNPLGLDTLLDPQRVGGMPKGVEGRRRGRPSWPVLSLSMQKLGGVTTERGRV
jgi:hypothetical protein